jgi:asparagine synthase (glutamine-hydrolysing)
MCGIAGFCDFSKTLPVQVLQNMTNSLAHRGPDADGIEFTEEDSFNLGLGHRRLSILDLSERGKQPLIREDISIVFNGEVYNFQEIRDELISKGYTFKSGTDTEVIVIAYQAWGMESIKKFIGMFAYALFDKSKSKLFLVRDRVGAKPLYYYTENKSFIFGSELKVMHENPSFKKRIDNDALALYLQYSYIPTPYCIFKNTFKLQPGHYVELDLLTQQSKEVKYWDVVDAYNQPKLNISYEDAVKETDTLLNSAFNYRMVADVPVGVFLSGGYDSTAVASILQRNRTEKIKTFTIGFKEAKFNEATEAKKIAEYIGTDHTEYYCTAKDATDILTQLPFVYDEPFADNSVVPTILVSQLARKQVKVALSGDGGDEIFGGYNKFNQSIGYTKNLPLLVQSFLAAGMKAINPRYIPYFSNTYNFTSRYEKMQKIWSSHSPYVALKCISHYITQLETRRLLNADFKDLETYFDIAPLLNDGNDELNKLLAIDYKTFLMDNNLVKIDRAAMSVGLEGREPFLDQRVIEFVGRLPSDYKIRDGVNKALLKSVVHNYVDKKLMDRPKMPFIAPLTIWFKNEMKELLIDHLDEKVLKEQGIFNPEEVIRLRDQYLNDQGVSHQKVWNILLFQLWYAKWMK